MKASDILQDSKTLSMADFENFFDVTKDREGFYRYNLNSSLYLNFKPSDLLQYVPSHDLHWTTISYNIYGTTRFAWLLCKINEVKDPVFPVCAGTPVFYIPQELVNSVVQYINS